MTDRESDKSANQMGYSDEFVGRLVCVMGLGTFGGGTGVVRFLLDRGARVRVSDLRNAEQLAGPIAELASPGDVEFRLEGNDWSHFSDADLVVVNPAVKPDNLILKQIVENQIPLTTEMNLFWERNPGRVVAVTGSNGKSTTTALIHSMIKASGQRCFLGGNIGKSLLTELDQITSEDWVVLEVSSFQLHWLDRIKARPNIAVVTNFTPNHLDWHETLEHYRRSKQSILRAQTADDWCVINAADEDVSSWSTNSKVVRCFGPKSESVSAGGCRIEDGSIRIQIGELRVELTGNETSRLRGPHNQRNIAMAAVAATLAGIKPAAVRQGVENFEPLPHRLQFVGEVDGRRFYNDSISTTPESTIAALKSFKEPIVLLAGGYDKGVDLSSMADQIARRAKAVVFMGQTAGRLSELCSREGGAIELEIAESFAEAFESARRFSCAGDIVLLSPGCASYGWFSSFTDRGDQFCRMVSERNSM